MRFTRIFAIALASVMLMGEGYAQVSVRRTPKKTESTQSSTADSKKVTTPKSSSSAGSTTTTPKSTGTAASKAPVPTLSKNNTAAKKSAGAKKPANTTVVSDGKSVRQRAFDEYQKENQEETRWQHVVYREIDLENDQNASLYFPVEPQDGLTSMFRVIFDAFVKGEIKGYEYLDGREVFSEKYEVKVKDILDKFDVYYQVKAGTGRDAKETYQIEDPDVPSSEVLSYYVKERWEFDEKHSKFGPRILCICPVLHRAGDTGSTTKTRYPMFWINFEDLRPFLRQHLVVSSGMNNAARYTMEEFLTLNQYDGTIYKEQNLRGLTLAQQYPNPDSLKMRQKELDERLREFGKSIWREDVQPEAEAEQTKKGRAEQKVAAPATRSANTEVVEKKNRRTKEEVDTEAAAAEKEAKATTRRSVRR